MAKVLVTGGAGFIGSSLVDALIEAGHQAVIINTINPQKKYYLNPAANLYIMDVRSPKISEIFAEEGFDFVYHLAAQIDVRKSVADPERDIDINVLGSLNIFNNCLLHGVKKVIYFSTGGIYGSVAKPATEVYPTSFDSPYALHKFTAEKNLALLGKIRGLNYTVFRPANVYGPRQLKGGEGAVIGIFAHNASQNLASTIYGDGLQTRDFVYVDDIINACLMAMEKADGEVLNLGSGEAVDLFALAKIIEQLTGQPFRYSHAPERAGEIKHNVLDSQRAKDVLHWRPQVDLSGGIAKVLQALAK